MVIEGQCLKCREISAFIYATCGFVAVRGFVAVVVDVAVRGFCHFTAWWSFLTQPPGKQQIANLGALFLY